MELREMKLEIEPHVRAPAPLSETMLTLPAPDGASSPPSPTDAPSNLDVLRPEGAPLAPCPRLA